MKRQSVVVMFLTVLIPLLPLLSYSAENGDHRTFKTSDYISQSLARHLVGVWNIQNYHQEDQFHEATGVVRIYSDGTFDLISGSFAAIGMGSGTAPNPMCQHTLDNQTFEIFTHGLVAFDHDNLYRGHISHNSVIPQLVKLSKDEIIFMGHGGCGISERNRISVLTRMHGDRRNNQ
jgi:hypothetical protein